MTTVFQDFKDTVEEVEHYFEFLQKIESGYTDLIKDKQAYRIDTNLSRMFKANAFLILYNLVEATIKNGLWQMFETIKNDSISYQNLIKDLQLLWVAHKIKLEFKTHTDTVNKKLDKVILEALQTSISYYTDKSNIKFESGNLDIKGINKTFKKHGLNIISAHEFINESFSKTKSNRNYLAHGDMTFKDCGKDYSYRDLRIIKCHIVRTLLKSLFHIKDFINQEKYKILVA